MRYNIYVVVGSRWAQKIKFFGATKWLIDICKKSLRSHPQPTPYFDIKCLLRKYICTWWAQNHNTCSLYQKSSWNRKQDEQNNTWLRISQNKYWRWQFRKNLKNLMLFFFSGDDKSAYKRQRASIVQSSPEGEPSQLLRYLHKPRWEGGKHNPKESNTKYWRKGIHALSCRVTALKCKFNNYIARKQGEWKITKCLLNPSKGEIINEFQWIFSKSFFFGRVLAPSSQVQHIVGGFFPTVHR